MISHLVLYNYGETLDLLAGKVVDLAHCLIHLFELVYPRAMVHERLNFEHLAEDLSIEIQAELFDHNSDQRVGDDPFLATRLLDLLKQSH